MSAEPAAGCPPLQLRVAVAAADPVAASRLAKLVAMAGHEAVAACAAADAILTDGSARAPSGAAVVAIGVEDGDFAGILPDVAGPAQLDAALRAVAAGLRVCPLAVQPPGFAALPEMPAAALTPREVEVLAALADGLGNKAVARRLGISPHTVKFHIEQLFRKLDAGSRAEAVAKGLRRQIVEF